MTYSMMVGKYKLIFSDTHFKDFRKKPTISVYDADTNSETKIASFNSQETFEWFVEAVVEADRKTENSSEKPNNCEHITEDGVTCAKYPACDDCLDNPLNKLKGSERLLKGSEIPNNCEDDEYWKHLFIEVVKGHMSDAEANQAWYEYINHKDKPQTCSVNGRPYSECGSCEHFKCTADEPQTEDFQDWKDRMWAEAVIEPQTDCSGCKFVGAYDTEFPCANCSRKTKDYYAKDESQTERSSE